MDISQTVIPKSDQQNFDDFLTGPKIVTISKVTAGGAEQPIDIHLVEFPGKAFRPSKSMRRVLVAAWGAESEVYVGRKMKLYGDPNVKFGGVAVGGIKIGALSHIDKTLKLALTATRGKREAFVVEPLRESRPAESVQENTSTISIAERLSTIGDLMGRLGMNELAARLAYAGDVIERPIASANELTKPEAERVISYLERDLAGLKEQAGEK
jgi:hypothetical protein